MKKLFYTLVLFLSSTMLALAQDVIYFNNGNQQKGTVVEINNTEIKYRKAENPDGPVYIINRAEVQMIEYANGYKDIITADNNNNNNSNQNDQANNNSGYRNQDTYINNYYTNPRPQVYIQVPPPAPAWGWGYARPHYWGGGYHHHHHQRRGCW